MCRSRHLRKRKISRKSVYSRGELNYYMHSEIFMRELIYLSDKYFLMPLMQMQSLNLYSKFLANECERSLCKNCRKMSSVFYSTVNQSVSQCGKLLRTNWPIVNETRPFLWRTPGFGSQRWIIPLQVGAMNHMTRRFSEENPIVSF